MASLRFYDTYVVPSITPASVPPEVRDVHFVALLTEAAHLSHANLTTKGGLFRAAAP